LDYSINQLLNYSFSCRRHISILFLLYFSKIPIAPFAEGSHPKLSLHFQRGIWPLSCRRHIWLDGGEPILRSISVE